MLGAACWSGVEPGRVSDPVTYSRWRSDGQVTWLVLQIGHMIGIRL